MDIHEAITHPKMGKKPPQLSNRCVMVANRPDLDFLHDGLKTGTDKTRRLLMSRLHYGYEYTPAGIVGPFIGAPYAAILLECLIAWEVCEVIFFGWCGAISENVRIGDVIIPDKSIIDDGTSKSYNNSTDAVSYPSPLVQSRLKSCCMDQNIHFHEGPVWSTDAIFRETKEKVIHYQKQNALAVEMESAALCSVGNFRGIDVGCILLVSDSLSSLKWQPGFSDPLFKERRRQVCEMICRLWSNESFSSD